MVNLKEGSSEIPLEASNKRIYYAGLLLLIFIIGGTIAAFYFKTQIPAETAEEIQELEVEEVVVFEEEITTETELERGEITLEILNGSGKSGLAGDTAEEFEALGYVINEIGNADPTTKSQIFINSEVEEKVKVLLSDAEEILDIASVSGELSDSSSSARIVIGSQ